MTVLLVGAATATGALAGFALGVAWLVSGLPPSSPPVGAALVVLALAADLVPPLARRAPPPCLRRQVPREWARLLPLPVAATLYGARLGVGPLTVLPTWVWWAGAVLGASLGPGPSALVGAAFGGLRLLVVVAASARAQPSMSTRMAGLRRREWLVARSLGLVALLGAALVLRLSAPL